MPGMQRPLTLALAMITTLAMAAGAGPAFAASGGQGRGPAAIVNHLAKGRLSPFDGGSRPPVGDETPDLQDAASQFSDIRNAPALEADPRALFAGAAQGRQLPEVPGSWRQLTDEPYQNDDLRYRDPVWSNSTAGWGLVSGRVSALATDGPRVVYAGAADGGVWRSDDRGARWQPLTDGLPALTIGALAVDPVDHAVWAGAGEANFSGDEYGGDGIYRSSDRGRTWQRVGQPFFGLRTSRLVFDGVGHVYAATSVGVLRHDLGLPSAPWTTVLAPSGSTTASFATDVQVRPHSGGRVVAAVIVNGGLFSAIQDGFWVSSESGAAGSFHQVAATGDLGPGQVGRTSFVWTADSSTLYAVVQNPLSVGVLTGVFRADSAQPAGPWTKIADSKRLLASGSQLCGGCQGWYDQYVTADPSDPAHVYLGLEEVFESSDRGATWQTIGPYWNFNLPCYNADPALNTCPPTTHPDQHAMAFANDGTAYFGNDGGVYSRPASLRGMVRWDDLNRGLHTLQYYSVGVGRVAGGDAVWGGMQDNGVSLLLPGARTMVSPLGGDGGQVVVDPANGLRAVNEYSHLATARTENGGLSDGVHPSYTTVSPSCDNPAPGTLANPCDPNTLFIAPYSADIHDLDHWVAGGRYVWDNGGRGWSTTCGPGSCDWTIVHDTGAQVTAVVASGPVTYAAWQNRDATGAYHSGIDTNAGGTWHRVAGAGLPSRYITSILVDPANASHLFISFGGYTERWVPGAGTGHVFESSDAGMSWTDVTGDLPDLPTTSLAGWHGLLVATTDAGVYVASESGPGRWLRLGHGLPNSSSQMIATSPDGGYLVDATHGRGLWTFGVR